MKFFVTLFVSVDAFGFFPLFISMAEDAGGNHGLKRSGHQVNYDKQLT